MDTLRQRMQAAREIVTDTFNSFWGRNDRLRRCCAGFHRRFLSYWFIWLPLLVICALIFALWDYFAPYPVDSVTHSRPQQVLAWWINAWHLTAAKLLRNDLLTSTCPTPGYKTCFVSKDRGTINASDAIVFAAERINLTDLPPYRRQSQAWVFLVEGPPQWPPSQDLLEAAPLFNWTMAFREDADIVVPYKAWTRVWNRPHLSRQVTPTRPKPHKVKTAAWMISECEQQQLRNANTSSLAASRWRGTERFITEVMDAIHVDLILDCGRSLCESRKQCLSLLEDQYIFVFVMESSPCFEHPAELIYDSFSYDIIPVFFGVGNFTHPLPLNTFIDTSKLRHASDAVNLLNRVISHPRAYPNFMTERQDFILSPAANMCALCQALHAPPNKSLHKDILHWWRSRSICSQYTAMQLPDAGTNQSLGANITVHS